MDQEIKQVEINGQTYVLEESIQERVFQFTGEQTVASIMIGKPVIVRSDNEGINIGIVELADDTGVVLKNCRRLYYHIPKDPKLSWYEGVAMSGLNVHSKVSGTVNRKVIVEKYSMIECKKEIYKEILAFIPNAQN